MKILFTGQLGVPANSLLNSEPAGSLRAEERVTELAKRLVEDGHEVAATGAIPYTSKHLSSIFGIQLWQSMSWDPRFPGGWLNTALAAKRSIKEQPHALHIHGWKMASLVPLLWLLMPNTSFIWTIDTRPGVGRKMTDRILNGAQKAGVQLVVPNRSLQYWLLASFGVRAAYIPDGFKVMEAPAVAARHFGLRGSYNLTYARTAKDVRKVAKAYKLAGIRRKLVVLADDTGNMKRVANEFNFLKCVGNKHGRALESLVQGSSLVIMRGDNISHNEVMMAMAYGKPVVAAALPHLEETLGVTAMYVSDKDEAGLVETLKLLGKSEARQRIWGKRAKMRYNQYFTWKKVLDEYAGLYMPKLVRVVAVDSALGMTKHQLPITNNQSNFPAASGTPLRRGNHLMTKGAVTVN